MAKKFRWINEDIVVDFPLPKDILNLIEELERLDLEDDWSYINYSETMDYAARDAWLAGLITAEQRDRLSMKYDMPDD